MAKSERAKTEKKFKMSSAQKQNAAIVFIAVLIVIYIAVELYGAFNVSLKTQTALASTVYETVDAGALVVRNEHTVQSGGGVTVSSVADCEKVVKGGEIALTFSSEEAASAYSQYTALEEELRYYADMEDQAVGQVTDVESLDSSILENIIISSEVDIPQSSEAIVKSKIQAIKNAFLPNNLENHSTDGTTIPLAIR